MAASESARLRVSVVVAVHGNVAALPGLVAAVAAQDVGSGDVEVVVVDNHARPRVPAWDGSVAGRVVHEPRPGLSRARNAGIRAASGDYLLVTDPCPASTSGSG